MDAERLVRLEQEMGKLSLAGLITVRTPKDQLGSAEALEDLIGPPDSYASMPDAPVPETVPRSAALDVLGRVFGYPAFRGQQAEIIDHVMGGGDARDIVFAQRRRAADLDHALEVYRTRFQPSARGPSDGARVWTAVSVTGVAPRTDSRPSASGLRVPAALSDSTSASRA